MKTVFSTLLLLCFHFSDAQKVVRKSISGTDVAIVQVDAGNCYRVSLATHEADEIYVKAALDGEYEDDLVLNLTKVGAGWEISAGFQPNFTVPNDKLSAHKVISISLKIQLPRHSLVQVYGTSSLVDATGIYKDISIVLDDGSCTLDGVVAQAEVHTQSGDIILKNTEAAIMSVSKYGQVFGKAGTSGNHIFKLTSVTGNIHLNKTE
jgi:hypothetical protein